MHERVRGAHPPLDVATFLQTTRMKTNTIRSTAARGPLNLCMSARMSVCGWCTNCDRMPPPSLKRRAWDQTSCRPLQLTRFRTRSHALLVTHSERYGVCLQHMHARSHPQCHCDSRRALVSVARDFFSLMMSCGGWSEHNWCCLQWRLHPRPVDRVNVTVMFSRVLS